ncbi:spherulation-specific family 4 protein [Arthrobacter sp. CDRTa11]|uniref:spherulation-specific family 4 protein n=1 Tax=Arthrobacter sp. CDRTa11 TaxID=2651199 RepID=UPI0022658142|nr:spherulation-specific family 4 protein [Arthrobacter sp. CDRTa11]
MTAAGLRLRRTAAAALASALLCLAAGCGINDPFPDPPPVEAGELYIAVPGYVAPPNSAYWQAVIDAAPRVREVIVNPRNGPGSEKSEAYVRLIGSLRDVDIRVLGYVETGYGDRDPDVVTEDIEHWRDWYDVDNVFLDEVTTRAADMDTYADYAATVHDAGGIVVLNPGLPPDPGYFEFADAIVTFEDPVDAYFNGRDPPDWLSTETRGELWHIVIGAPQDRLADIVDRARQLGVDQIYVTDDAEPNPYDTLPGFWSAKLDAIQE